MKDELRVILKNKYIKSQLGHLYLIEPQISVSNDDLEIWLQETLGLILNLNPKKIPNLQDVLTISNTENKYYSVFD